MKTKAGSIDFLGVPASNAGDAFHEIWVTRKALELLDPESRLVCLTAEGMPAAISGESNNRSWDGVDCALFYGKSEEGPFDRVEIVQLKYSPSAPEKNWTLGRLTENTRKKGNNSVARRLADAFNGIIKENKLTYEDAKNTVTVSLVTNQPISQSLADLVQRIRDGKPNSQETEKLREATGLKKTKLKLFCECLDLKGGEQSRADLEVDVTRKIGQMIDVDARDSFSGILMEVNKRMQREGRGERITRATVESWFGVGQSSGLFPCEAKLETVKNPVNRTVNLELAEAVKDNKFVCFHGEGGHGKTIAVQELEALLPPRSKVILYDCFGTGEYRDPSKYRHQPLEAFTQLSNELALAMRAPSFFPYRENPSIIRSFRKRLDMASELMKVETPEALLVVLVDAADNAVAASRIPAPADECFVHDLMRMSTLPDNVRIVISTRTSRKDSLLLPPGCETVLCPPFSLEETGELVARRFQSPPKLLVEQFHHLSNGSPRVQSSAWDGCDSFEDAIESLRPRGKSLEDVYEDKMNEVILRAGGDISMELLCAALWAVPSPAPADLLGAVCETNEIAVTELCKELAPYLRVVSQKVEFANEDFEHFCEKRGDSYVGETRNRLANELLKQKLTSEYAAVHLFDVLVAAGRGEELPDLLDEKDATRIISDPVVRQRTDLARLRASVSVVSRHKNAVEAVKTILVGSGAVETNWKVTETVLENLDLSACFAQSTVCQLVLNDPERRRLQGALLAYLSKQYALEGKPTASREAFRGVYEWSRSGEKHGRNPKKEEFVAVVTGFYKNDGWKTAEEYCERYSELFSVFLKYELLKFIAISEGRDRIREIRQKMNPRQRWTACVLIKRCGGEISAEELEDDLEALMDFDFGRMDLEDLEEFEKSKSLPLVDGLLFFAEICGRSGINSRRVGELVGKFLPKKKRKIEHAMMRRPYIIDFSFRAARLEALGKNISLKVREAFEFPESQGDTGKGSGNEQPRSFESNIRDAEQLLPFYEALAAAYSKKTDQDPGGTASSLLQKAKAILSRAHPWELEHIAEMTGRRIFDLQIINGTNVDHVLELFDNSTPRAWPFDSLQLAMRDDEFFDKIAKFLSDYASAVENSNLLATEKAEELIKISRFLLPVSEDESRTYFEKALNIVKDIDYELIYQLNCLLEMADGFYGNTSRNRKRAEDTARLIRRAGMLLGDEKSFPYAKSMEAVASLSAPVAACVLNRWTDEGFVETDMHVEIFLRKSLIRKTLPESHVTALCLLAGYHGASLTDSICESAKSLPESVRDKILGEIAGRELMNLTPDAHEAMSEPLERLAASLEKPNAMFSKLADTYAFLKSNSLAGKRETNIKPPATTGAENRQKPDWSGVDILDPDSMSSTMETNRAAGYRDEKTYYSDLAARVRPGDRIGHLNALARIAKSKPYPENKAVHIANCLRKWEGEAVKEWARKTLPGLIVELSPTIMIHGGEPFESLVEASGITGEKLKDTIVAAVERNAHRASSNGLLKYTAALVGSLPEEKAGEVFDWYVSRLNDRIDVRETSPERHDIPIDDLPDAPDEIAAAFLYRFLGDVDVRCRWRAAHSVRAFIRLGNEGVVPALVRHALSAAPRIYTFGDMPFHELTARLFLVIILARVAFESPETIAAIDNDVLRLATDGPPHIMIEHYVKRALIQADKAAGMRNVSVQQVKRLARPVKGYAKTTEKRDISFRSRTSREDIRFNFDLFDTLPYWYDPALRNFTDMSAEEFIKRADHWIVDRWNGNDGNPRQDPRHERLERIETRSLRHGGSYSTVETRARHLEWHAMCVVVGEFLRTRPLAETEDGIPFEKWVEGWDTLYEGTWVCDLLRPIPPEPRYWVRPSEDDPDWLNPPREKVLLAELFCETSDRLVISSSRETVKHSSGKREAGQAVWVEASLVPPETAPALARVFQAADEPWDVQLPNVENPHSNEIRIEGFTARRTAVDSAGYSDGGFDSSDPKSGNAAVGVSLKPGESLVESLGLSQPFPWSRTWSSTESDRDICRYDVWNAPPGDGSPTRSRFYTATYGNRLTIDAEALMRTLEKSGDDLLAVVKMKNFRGEGYEFKNGKDENQIRSVGCYILRQDGTVENANGKIAGTWLQDSQGHRG